MRVLRLCVGVCCVAMVAAGSGAAASQRAGVSPFAPVTGGTLTIGTSLSAPSVLNPTSSSASSGSLYATAPVLLGAFSQQPDGSWQPELVTSADLSTGPFTVTYHINPAAEWSDGVAVTAADFIFTWQTLTDPGNAYGLITSMNAIDDETVSATFSSVYAPWRSLFATVLPQHVLDGQDMSTVWNSAIDDPGTSDPIGDGPYLVSSFDVGDFPSSVTLTKNANWWGAHAPYLDSIVLDFFGGDQAAELDALSGGGIQAIYEPPPPSAPSTQTAFAALWSTKGMAVQSKSMPFVEHLAFNLNSGLLGDLWVRQAVAESIDRAAIAKAVWGPVSPSLPIDQSALLYPGEVGFSSDFAQYGYSSTGVASLMEAHGCALGGDKIWICGGQRMSFTITYPQGNTRRILEVGMMQAEAKVAGIELVPTPMDPNQIFGSGGIAGGHYQVALYAEVTSGDPLDWDADFTCAGAGNWTGYCNPDTDTALAAADGELDPAQRVIDISNADALLAGDLPTLPLWAQPDLYAYSTQVGGVIDNPYAGPLWNAQDVWLFGGGATPTIGAFTPDHGPIGSVISIAGSGFTGTTSVSIGATKAKSFTVVRDDLISAVVGPGTSTGAVTVTNAAGGVSTSSPFTVGPTVASFLPAKGAIGATVTISGSGFTGATDVTFGGTDAQSFSVVSDSKITAVIAAGTTTGAVEVIGPGGTSTSSKSLAFGLSVSSLTPDHGPVGTSVTIGGSGFTGATAVKFNGTNAESFSVDSDTQITAAVAAGTKTGKVTVTGPGGTATSLGTYTVSLGISSFSPAKGPIGSTVTLTGSGFAGVSGPDAVQFNGTDAQSYTVVSNAKITAVVAAGTTSGTITVTGPGLVGSATSGIAFVVGPKIDSFTPTQGPAPSVITIHGSGFTGVTAVKIGTASAQGYTVDSDTQITAHVWPGAKTGKVTVTGPGGTATSAANFSVTLEISALSPSKGPAGTTVTITGTGFTGATAVRFNGTPAQSFSVVSNTKITAVVAGGTVSGPIAVDSVGGTATSNGSFALSTSISSFSPLQGVAGTTITINGSGFTGASAVTINGKSVQAFTVDSDVAITATVAFGTTTGKVAVATPSGGATSKAPLTVLSITSFTPTQGRLATVVTVTGSGFTGATEVDVNGAAEAYTVVSDTKVTLTVAAGTTSGVITVTAPAGTATSANGFTVTFALFDLAVCPASDTHMVSGVPTCNSDWSGSAFAPGDEIVCSVDYYNGGGHSVGMDLLQGATKITSWGPDTIADDGHWYAYLDFSWDPQIPNGSYQCRVMIDGAVAATKSFKISQ
jgi:ABC-type transport system substrate-binding protein